jgi:hypothetical protein
MGAGAGLQHASAGGSDPRLTATGATVSIMTQTQGFEPIAIRLARKKCEALAIAEEGRHEDCLTALAEWNTASKPKDEKPDTCHAYDVASKALDTRGAIVALRIDSANAAIDLYYAVCSGTFQIDNFKAATRIANALRDRVRRIDPGMVQRWQTPYGP